MKSILSLFCLVAVIGCSSSDSPCPGVNKPTGPYTISGHITFAHPITMPSDAELICYWPENTLSGFTTNQFDSSRVFGRGTVDLSSNTFSLTFQGVPPALATAKDSGSCKAAVLAPAGYILLVSKSDVNKVQQKWFDTQAVLGAVDSTAMLYYASNTPLHGWLSAFPQGYSVGRDSTVVYNNYTTDSLLLRPNTGLELRIDTTSSPTTPAFHFPHNWLSFTIQTFITY